MYFEEENKNKNYGRKIQIIINTFYLWVDIQNNFTHNWCDHSNHDGL